MPTSVPPAPNARLAAVRIRARFRSASALRVTGTIVPLRFRAQLLRPARLDSAGDPREPSRQALPRQAGAPRRELRARARRLPRRHRAERLRQDDAAAALRRAALADRGETRGGADTRADRVHRPRGARLSRPERAREPRALRPSLPRGGAARADRNAAGALRPLGRAARACRIVLARDAAAARPLPD